MGWIIQVPDLNKGKARMELNFYFYMPSWHIQG
jgi:hypothetical protein